MQQEKSISDMELLSAIAAGDESAFRLLFDQYREVVFNYLVNITKSKEASEELLSDIFMKLWLGREWVGSIQNMEAFLKKVSYNKAIDYLRHVARKKKLQEVVATEIDITAGRTPENILLEKDFQRVISEAIEQLSPQRKIVYKLSREQNFTHEEIAQKLSLSANTVSNHIKASLQSIKGYLQNKHGEELAILILFLHLSSS